MRKILAIILVLFPLFSVFAQEDSLSVEDYITESLLMIKMTPKDCKFSVSITDSFRLKIVDHLLENPLEANAYSDNLARSLSDSSTTLSDKMKIAAKEMDCSWEEKDFLWEEDFEGEEWLSEMLPTQVIESINLISLASEDVTAGLDVAFSELSSGELSHLKATAADTLREQSETEWLDRTVWQVDEARKKSMEANKRFWRRAAKIRREHIAEAGFMAFTCVETVDSLLMDVSDEELRTHGNVSCENASGDILYYEKRESGDIIIGGAGETVYFGEFALIIDLGGDDKYFHSAGGADTSLSVAYCFDLAGDDLYSSRKHHSFGAGYFGVGMLIDYQGNDTYLSESYTLGSGQFGVGLLWDKSGSDFYSGNGFLQASGVVGFGFLLDNNGNDTYQGNLYCQGFSSVGGFGYLEDSDGNDLYNTQAKYTDRLRYKDHSLTLSQGFSIGERPDYSGGIGMLHDLAGNDVYISDIYGQGSAYWFAIGALIDRNGNDTYKSHQYAQGAGIHIAVGTLLDEDGDDAYVSKGVSQGCGHDLAIGYLYDVKGDDSYSAYDLSQGAGSANGIGLLLDQFGKDGYLIKKSSNSQGYGNPRREYGSIGMLIDIHGEDFYSGEAEAENQFHTKSKWGIKADFE